MPKKTTKAVTNKKTETIEVKNNTAKEEETKPVVKKSGTKAKKVVEKKEETKPETKVVEKKETKPAKKAATKKTTAKKAVEKKEEIKPETKVVEKKETKPATKAATKKTVEKTEETKPVTKTVKTTTKKATKPVVKKTVKPVTKKNTSKKTDQYNKLSLDTCFDLIRSMGIELSPDEIVRGLMLNPDVSKFSDELVKKYNLKGKYKFEEDGYDEDLIHVVVKKVYDNTDVKPTSIEDLKADIDQAMAYLFIDDIKDGKEYNRQFDIMRKILVLAQNKEVHDSKILDDEINADIEKFVVEFMDLAYKVLKTWKYEDVDYYEQFIFAVLSQFENLHKLYHNRIMMDVADLYILHGDYGLGDADYGYILRENQIKDYIYYRYASVYENIDVDKAKQIAAGALQYVDDRYTYYSNIMAILEK